MALSISEHAKKSSEKVSLNLITPSIHGKI
nr:MAG TPA: hypothetical protein [Caudoviricetes sp.]